MYRPPAYGYVHQPGSSPDLVLWEFLWQFHQVGLIVNLISSPSYIFPQRMGHAAPSCKLLIMTQSFWPILKSDWSPQTVISLEQKMLLSPRKCQVIQSSLSGTGSETKYQNKRCSQDLTMLFECIGNLERFPSKCWKNIYIIKQIEIVNIT